MAAVTLHLLIHGRVQGVGYRAWFHAEVEGSGLSGWVRNLRSGEVEAVVHGPAEAIEALVEACRRGPIGARVDGIVRSESNERPSGFSVRPTV